MMKWDDKVPEDMLKAWKELIAEAVTSDMVCFPRCIKPAGALGQPLVVVFSDGAYPA